MSERPKLNIVDDPVRSVPVQAPAATPSKARRRRTSRTSSNAQAGPPPPAPAQPPTPAPAKLYGAEEKRAVFGRVPKSLSRRLERAVVELREDIEDLTQEQLLAALLDKHVDPSNPGQLEALTETVRVYRTRL